MTVDLAEYISAGYYITSYTPRPGYVAESLPERILSGSECICTFVSDTAGMGGALGIDPDRLEQWVYQRLQAGEIGWPNVLFSLSTARDLIRDLLAGNQEAVIIGLGLHTSFVATFFDQDQMIGTNGLGDALQLGEPLAAGGCVLGFEPLVLFGTNISCSWLCNHLERECQHALGIVPNEHGFLSTFEEATRCTQHISRDDVGSEPGLWLPWLMVKYDQS